MADRHPMVGRSSRRKPCCGFEFDHALHTDGWEWVSQTSKVSSNDFPEDVCGDLVQAMRYRDAIYGAQEVAKDSKVELGPCNESVTQALQFMRKFEANPRAQAFCRTRLDLLKAAFDMYKLENQDEELVEIEKYDACFDSVPKVDTHLHGSAMMPASVLARKIAEIFEKDQDRPCGDTTIGQLLRDAGMSEKDTIQTGVSVDKLKVRGGYSMFKDFSNFNAAFTPMGSKAIKDLLFGFTTLEGEYLYQVVEDCARTASLYNIFLEPRFSIYGRKKDEWATMAKWARRWNVPQLSEILIGIQLPRIYPVWRKAGMVSSFGEFMTNFWGPVLEAAANPEAAGNEDIAWFLRHVRVIDTVDDESKSDDFEFHKLPPPNDWTSTDNPPYAYYHYYMMENLRKLNSLCLQNLDSSEIVLRPHCGESGETHHLITTFLMAQGISHGIKLEETAVMQYLYYLTQIPIGVSPLSNSTLFCKYQSNPFPQLFHRGLNVCLTTDDPMMFHITDVPLLEEYACARASFDLDTVDMCEVARNSCRGAFSGTERDVLHGEEHQDPNKTNIPMRRMLHRLKKLELERSRVQGVAGAVGVLKGGVEDLEITKAEIRRIFKECCGADMRLSKMEFQNVMKHLKCDLSTAQLDVLHDQLLLLNPNTASSKDTVDMQVLIDYLLQNS